MRQLALFDLDHTLLPIDSDFEWSRHLIKNGVIDGQTYERENDRFMREYQAGTLDIAAYLRFQLAPLAAHPRDLLDAWHAGFMTEAILPVIRPAARDLVNRHLDRGDLVALVTATNEFVTGPIAQAFRIEHLVATTIEAVDGRFTGRSLGVPSFREGKVTRTDAWLAGLGLSLGDFNRSYYYGDSRNDLPMMLRVTDPIATNPDPVLSATAQERGWPVLRLFE